MLDWQVGALTHRGRPRVWRAAALVAQSDPIAARKAVQIARNAAGVIAVELMAGAAGIDYHAPLKTSAKLQGVHAAVREYSPHLVSDRYWAGEMAALQRAILAGEIESGLGLNG